MSYFDTGNLTNASTPGAWFDFANEVTANLFGDSVCLLFWFAFLAVFLAKNDFDRSFFGASALTFILAVLMWAGGFASWLPLGLSLGASLVGALLVRSRG